MKGGRGEKSRFRDEVEGKEGDGYGVGGDKKDRGKQEKGQWRERVGETKDDRLKEGGEESARREKCWGKREKQMSEEREKVGIPEEIKARMKSPSPIYY